MTAEVQRNQETSQQNTVSNQPDIKNQEWFKQLSPDQQNRAREIHEKMIEIHKQLEIANATSQITGTGVRIMNRWVLKNPTAVSNPEFQRNQELMELWQRRFDAAKEQSESAEITLQKLSAEMQALRQQINTSTPPPPAALTHGNTPVVPTLESNNTISQKPDISKMTNADILKLAPTERLPYITRDNKESSEVVSGVTLEFTFSSGGKLNRDLYMYTTAGQVLPNEVREVSSNGVSYIRQGLSGEFYNPDSQKRLTIHEWTGVTIEKVTNKEELKKITEENTEKYNRFVVAHEKYNWDAYKDIITTAIEKQIEPELFIMVADNRNETFDGTDPIPRAELERYARDFAVGFSRNPPKTDGTKYTIESTIEILNIVAPAWSDDILKAYWYDITKVQEYREKHPRTARYNPNDPTLTVESEPWEYKWWIVSEEAKITMKTNWEKMTWCSETARINLENLGIRNIKQWSSAKKSFDMYAPSEISPVTLQWNSNAKVADIYLEASKKNAEFGHRVAAFQKDGKWYVLDPYYAMPGMWKTQQPIPLELYKSTMEWTFWRKFWWAHYFA